MNAKKPIVLFLCTGNSCRSQMAEGILRSLAGEHFEVLSAGYQPKQAIHPLAERVMNEVGIDITDQEPKGIDVYMGKAAVKFAVFVCEATETECPRIYPGSCTRLYWPFRDPAAFVGSDDETLKEFRRVRDSIDEQIRDWLNTQEVLCLTQ